MKILAKVAVKSKLVGIWAVGVRSNDLIKESNGCRGLQGVFVMVNYGKVKLTLIE